MHIDERHNYIIRQDWIKIAYSLTFQIWKMLHKCFVQNKLFCIRRLKLLFVSLEQWKVKKFIGSWKYNIIIYKFIHFIIVIIHIALLSPITDDIVLQLLDINKHLNHFNYKNLKIMIMKILFYSLFHFVTNINLNIYK